ncbi:aminopeptidase Ey-like [Ambystoma mexicanum]|uniref:aminopeptidase Ey-like n=1 Tax=Ambystoma mexicanum TaxID=8296 RepID=UPI0037E96F30
MAKGFYVSRAVLVAGILFSVAAIATIVALSIVYSEQKLINGNANVLPSSPAMPTSTPSSGATIVGHSTPPPNSTSTAPPNSTVMPTAGTTSGQTDAGNTTPQASYPWKKYRLPRSLIPEHYDLELQPFLEEDPRGLYIFKGTSSIYFTAVEATSLILLHSKKLNYTDQGGFHISLNTTDGSSPPSIKRTWLETPTQYLVVELHGDLAVGKTYALYSDFTGELANDLAGFYRSEYLEGNETRVIAATQFAAPDARKAFPCFDEPALKATFSLTLIHDPQSVALSNMPNMSTVPRVIDLVTWHVTKFEKSPKMSTYLLAFIVSDFGQIEQVNGSAQIRIWARKKAIQENQGAYALSVTGPILNFLQDYYKVPYPLPKSDQVALPDFSAGAMENWGLITYRETSLLYDPSESSIGNKERVVTVVAHELAHQWFGNLVTLKWWNDIWLNEGFASYVEYLGADDAEKSWNIKDLIVLNDVYKVMEVDALASSHPLSSREEEVNTPAEIGELFDSISYSKGASVIRMLSDFLSEKLFVEGLSSYLQAFAYNNTIYDDLWSSLQKAVDNQTAVQLPRDIKSIMDTWVLQMGFPVVTVNTSSGEITQNHFLLDPHSAVTRPSAFNYTWTVPITWMKSGSVQSTFWLLNKTDANGAFKVSSGSSDWVLANLNVTGYFRVNYDKENWARLLRQLEVDHRAIPVANRAQIIDDAFNLARAKHIDTTSALETTRFLSGEREYMPWEAALGSLRYLTLMFDRSSVYGPMKQYLRKQVEPLFLYFKNVTNEWTLRPEGLTEQYSEINAISTTCSQGVPECWALASGLYREWMSKPHANPITPNLRPAVYCNAIAIGGEEEWDFAWKMFRNTTVAGEADRLRAAMACSKEPWILNRYLEYTLDPKRIRKQDAIATMSSIASNAVGQSLVWDFVRANWGTIFSEFGGTSFSFSGLIEAATRRFSSEFELMQLAQFKKDNEDIGFGSASRSLEQALEKTKANIKWVQENREPVKKWFEDEVRRSS